MAVIDKIYLSDYSDYEELLLWCLVYKPTLLQNFYYPFLTRVEWDRWRESVYRGRLKSIKKKLKKEGTEEAVLLEYNKLSDKTLYMEVMKLPITNFSPAQNKYLVWNCPIPFVRDYLLNKCGVTTKWYHKIFWKKL